MTSTVKSGTIEELIFVVSLYAPPGLGFNFSISEILSLKSSSLIFNLALILSKCLFENSSNKSLIILLHLICFYGFSFFLIVDINILGDLFAPIPAGSKRYILSSIFEFYFHQH